VHSILDGSPSGVTLHVIDKLADRGPVWAQKEIPLLPSDTAFTIHQRLQAEIVALFRETWPKIVKGEIQPKPQDERKAVYHKKSEVDKFDRIDPAALTKTADLLNLLRARSFGNMGFAYFEVDGRRVYLNLRLSDSIHFD
jgi:methionyl-tRNA formyltransferase